MKYNSQAKLDRSQVDFARKPSFERFSRFEQQDNVKRVQRRNAMMRRLAKRNGY